MLFQIRCKRRNRQKLLRWDLRLIRIVVPLLLFLALIPNIYLAHYYAAGMAIAVVVMALSLSLLFACVLPLRWWLLLLGLPLLLLPIELTSWLSVDTPLNYGVYLSIRETNWNEAVEQLRGYWLPIVCFVLFLVLYFGLLFRFIPRGVWLSRRFRRWLFPILLLVIGVLPLVAMNSEQGGGASWRYFLSHRYHPALKQVFNTTFPFDILRYTLSYQKSERELVAILAQREHLCPEAVCTLPDSVGMLGVLVVGETSRACNWQLAGYERPTNPKLANREHLYFFDDVYTGSNLTLYAVPMLISESTPREAEKWHTEPLLPELFRAAGFQTGWITSQSVTRPWMQLVLASTDFKRYLLQEDAHQDGEMLPYLDEFLQQSASRAFLALHTLGGHFNYSERYPPAFQKFQPGMESVRMEHKGQGMKFRRELINAFDNTILYTDWFLNEIIERLAALHRPAFLVYVADHGENIFDTDELRFLHASDHPTHYEAHVPFLIWLSEEYRAAYPEVAQCLEEQLHAKHHSTVTFATFLSLAHVPYKGAGLLDSAYRSPAAREVLSATWEIFPEPPPCGQ